MANMSIQLLPDYPGAHSYYNDLGYVSSHVNDSKHVQRTQLCEVSIIWYDHFVCATSQGMILPQWHHLLSINEHQQQWILGISEK